MSYPCIDSNYFDVAAPGIVSPKRRWQWDLRNTAEAAAATFVPANNAAGTVLQTVMAQWVNDTGVPQQVYAMMTQGAARITIDQLKEPIIEWSWGTSFGAAPADPALSEKSQMRVKADFGTTTISSTTYGVYYILEERQPSSSLAIGDVITLPAGQTVKAKAQCRWLTASWGLDWYTAAYGSPIPERAGEVQGLRMDMFSMPIIT